MQLVKVLIVCWMFYCLAEGNSQTFGNSTNINLENDLETLSPLACQFAPGLRVGNRMRELHCCNETVKEYYLLWSTVSLPLTRFLETLRQWDCPQFQEQCEKKIFAFTDYTELVYDYFCNYPNLVEKCLPRVVKIVSSAQDRLNYSISDTSLIESLLTSTNSAQKSNDFGESISAKRWRNAISQIHPARMTLEELLEPCVEIAQYDQEEVHDGSYQELINFLVPTCQLTWCGFSGEAFRDHVISFWTCLSSSCQSRVLLLLVIFGVMAFFTTVLNVMVILVLSMNSRLKHSQSTYKISLATADLLVGLVVLPTCIYTLAAVYQQPLSADVTRTVAGYKVSNGSLGEENAVIKKNVHENLQTDIVPISYRNGVGFWTSLSLFVSVYTLAAAGFDRLAAVYKPMTYSKAKANKIAKGTCVISWVVAAIFALVPIFVPGIFEYGIIFSTIVLSLYRAGIILYIVALLIPLIVVWITNISVYIVIKKHTNSVLTKMSKHSKTNQNSHVEKRLAATLRLMVGVFTFNTLPVWLTFICNILLPRVSGVNPETLSPKAAADFITVQFVSVILLFGNSLCNFFIYNIRNKEFRSAFKRMMRDFLKNIHSPDCCQSPCDWLRNTWKKHFVRRKLSSVSSSILNFRKKSSSLGTEEMVIEKNSSTSKTRATSDSNSTSEWEKIVVSNSAGKKPKKKQMIELPSVSEQDDSVFQSYVPDVGVNRFYSSVMRKFSGPLEPTGTTTDV